MTKMEFLPIMAYIEAAIGKELPDERTQVYWELLGDLPVQVLQTAAQRVVLQHVWATFPSVAELRMAAAETMQGTTADLSPAEAWQLAWKAAGAIDLEISGPFVAGGQSYPSQAAYHMKNLPALVVEAMQSFGLSALCYGKEPVGVVRAQFTKIYEQLLARDKKRALLPDALRKQIEEMPAKQLAQKKAMKQVAQIGMMPDDKKGGDCRP